MLSPLFWVFVTILVIAEVLLAKASTKPGVVIKLNL